MKIKVEIVSETGDKLHPESARRDVRVETHEMRGDSFNVATVDSLIEGDGRVFMVPAGGRLVLTAPRVGGEMVYDRDQAAAVLVSQQNNTEGRADQVDLEQVAKDKQAEADRAKAQAKERQDRQKEADTALANVAPPQGTQPAHPAPGTPGGPMASPQTPGNPNPIGAAKPNPIGAAMTKPATTTPSGQQLKKD